MLVPRRRRHWRRGRRRRRRRGRWRGSAAAATGLRRRRRWARRRRRQRRARVPAARRTAPEQLVDCAACSRTRAPGSSRRPPEAHGCPRVAKLRVLPGARRRVARARPGAGGGHRRFAPCLFEATRVAPSTEAPSRRRQSRHVQPFTARLHTAPALGDRGRKCRRFGPGAPAKPASSATARARPRSFRPASPTPRSAPTSGKSRRASRTALRSTTPAPCTRGAARARARRAASIRRRKRSRW